MVSPDFVTQTKTKTNPSSILHPSPNTLGERQQPAQAIKIPSLFTAPVPKDRLSSQLPTNLLPKNAPTPCESVILTGLPWVFQADLPRNSAPLLWALHLWWGGSQEALADFGYLPTYQM